MPLLVRGIGKGASSFVDPLVLLVRRLVLVAFDNSGTPFHDIPGVLPGFGRGPSVWGHHSSAWGRLMNSIVSVGDDPVPSGHCIICSHSKMGGFAWRFGMGSGGRGPSIGRCC